METEVCQDGDMNVPEQLVREKGWVQVAFSSKNKSWPNVFDRQARSPRRLEDAGCTILEGFHLLYDPKFEAIGLQTLFVAVYN